MLPLVPLAPSLELGPSGSLSGGITLELVQNKAGQKLCLPSARVAALVLGGSGEVIFPVSPFQVLAEVLVGGGTWGGSPGAGKVHPHPLQLELLGTKSSEEAHTLPMCFSHHSELWGLLPDFVLHACPQRGVLGWGFESPCSLMPNRERKHYRVFLPLAGLESMVGQEAFSALHWEPSPALGTMGGGGGTAVPCAPLPTAVGRPSSLQQGGGSPLPPDHCDKRVGICRHGGDQRVACPKQSPSPWDLGPWEPLPISKLVLSELDLKSRGKLCPA